MVVAAVFHGKSANMADDKDVAEKTIAEDLVVTKYKMAGELVNSECHLNILLTIKGRPPPALWVPLNSMQNLVHMELVYSGQNAMRFLNQLFEYCFFFLMVNAITT